MTKKKLTKHQRELGPWQEAWLQTLESGTFYQCKGKLCSTRNDGQYEFCCLGIACEVILENKFEIKGVDVKEVVLTERMLRPNKLFKTFGLRGKVGGIFAYSKCVFSTKKEKNLILVQYEIYDMSLVSMNDSGMTFKEIAAFIRRNSKHVFYRTA